MNSPLIKLPLKHPVPISIIRILLKPRDSLQHLSERDHLILADVEPEVVDNLFGPSAAAVLVEIVTDPDN